MLLYLAPMEGLTTYVFRTAYHHHFTGIDKYFTPFLSNRSLTSREKNEILPEHNLGLCLVPQILTNRAEEFLEIAKRIADYGYDTVNLNLGCPSGTVTAKGRGAGFLAKPEELKRFLDTVFEKCPLKISVKTRIGMTSPEEWEGLLALYSAFPMEELIIHPRLGKDFYAGQPSLSAYKEAQETLDMPLCYNGDILTAENLASLQSLFPETRRFMLGRGILRTPGLAAELKGEPLSEAALSSALTAFHQELLEGYCSIMPGEQPVLYKMKDFWTFLGQGLQAPDKLLKGIKKATTITQYRAAVSRLLEP